MKLRKNRRALFERYKNLTYLARVIPYEDGILCGTITMTLPVFAMQCSLLGNGILFLKCCCEDVTRKRLVILAPFAAIALVAVRIVKVSVNKNKKSSDKTCGALSVS